MNVVVADTARGPVGAVGTIIVGAYQHVLTGAPDHWGGVAQFFEGVVLISLGIQASVIWMSFVPNVFIFVKTLCSLSVRTPSH